MLPWRELGSRQNQTTTNLPRGNCPIGHGENAISHCRNRAPNNEWPSPFVRVNADKVYTRRVLLDNLSAGDFVYHHNASVSGCEWAWQVSDARALAVRADYDTFVDRSAQVLSGSTHK